MAAKKTTTTTKSKVVEAKPAVEEKPMVEEVVVKEFKDNDHIPCFSITAGEYLFVGDKSGDLYTWLADGDVVDVRYDDLVAAIRMRRPAIFKPRFVIQDDDFLAKYPDIQKLYDSLYSPEDLRSILTLPANRMATVINGLPDGAKESLKSMALSEIENGNLDSAQRVRVLDQIYGTDMLIKLTN